MKQTSLPVEFKRASGHGIKAGIGQPLAYREHFPADHGTKLVLFGDITREIAREYYAMAARLGSAPRAGRNGLKTRKSLQ